MYSACQYVGLFEVSGFVNSSELQPCPSELAFFPECCGYGDMATTDMYVTVGTRLQRDEPEPT